MLTYGDSALNIIYAAATPELAKQLGLTEFLNPSQLTNDNAIFELIAGQLGLHLMLDQQRNYLTLSLDGGDLANRASKVSKTNELIARAIGCKPHFRPSVLDATAGMGRDSLIMLMLGCQVLMQERNPIIFHLLKNAVGRFLQSGQLQKNELERFQLREENSIDSLGDLSAIDVIYLDPMFPERKKSALVKKEMRLFKKIAGEDPDADQLLELALISNIKRVVVKRPKGAPCLMQKKPSHEISGKKFRFDVYLT